MTSFPPVRRFVRRLHTGIENGTEIQYWKAAELAVQRTMHTAPAELLPV